MRPERPEKLHYFQYRIDNQKEIKQMESIQSNKKILDEELKVLINLGVKKNESYTNYDLLRAISKFN
jgi:hypothetical protein